MARLGSGRRHDDDRDNHGRQGRRLNHHANDELAHGGRRFQQPSHQWTAIYEPSPNYVAGTPSITMAAAKPLIATIRAGVAASPPSGVDVVGGEESVQPASNCASCAFWRAR